jgi:hypothetical protein
MTGARVEAGLFAGFCSGAGLALCALGALWVVARVTEAAL